MSLATFSRILSPKSSVTKRQSSLDESLSLSGPKRPSTVSPRFHSKQKEGALSSRSSKKESRAYAFTFDLFGSFRAKSKLAINGSNVGSGSRANQSRLSYSGYEDEDYGEPEAEAEEIRRPSGLGRRASISEEALAPDHSTVEGSLGVETHQEDQQYPQDIEKMSLISHETESEELAEIRYPSGLGDFRPTLNIIHDEMTPSTYPIFEGYYMKQPHDGLTILEPAFWQPTAPQQSSGLPKIIPLLAPYLSRQTLRTLALVDNAVAEPSKRLLWQDISLKMNLSSGAVNGDASLTPIDTLSSRYELARVVRSMELHICSEASTPTPSPRRRPPPLLLCQEPPSVSTPDIILSTPKPVKSRSASFSLEDNIEEATQAVSSQIVQKERFSARLRRASYILRPSQAPKTISPESPASKLHTPGVNPLSAIKRRSSAFIGKAVVQPPSPPQSPVFPSENADLIAPSPKICLPGDSNWTPPSDWDWTPPAKPRRFSSVPSPAQSSFTSSPSSPSPQTGLNIPHSWNPPGTHSSGHRSRSKPSLSSLKTGLQASGSLKPSRDLRSSPSLPSLRSPRSPLSPGFSNSATEDIPVSPVTTPVSPTTPYSTVSLSAFPLPPQLSPPPSVPPLPLEFFPSILPSRDLAVPPSPSLSTPTRISDNVLSQKLRSAATNLVNLTHVTLFFNSPSTAPSSPGPASINLNRLSGGHDGEKSPDTNSVDALRGFLLKLQSLQTLKVMCAPGQEPFHRAQWSGLKSAMHDLEVEIVCASY